MLLAISYHHVHVPTNLTSSRMPCTVHPFLYNTGSFIMSHDSLINFTIFDIVLSFMCFTRWLTQTTSTNRAKHYRLASAVMSLPLWRQIQCNTKAFWPSRSIFSIGVLYEHMVVGWVMATGKIERWTHGIPPHCSKCSCIEIFHGTLPLDEAPNDGKERGLEGNIWLTSSTLLPRCFRALRVARNEFASTWLKVH